MIEGTGGPDSGGPAGQPAKPAARSAARDGLDLVKRIIGGRAFKYAFVACAVGYGGYEIWRQWGDIHHALVRIGPVPAVGALIVLFGMQFSNLRAWQVLLAGLGSPLRTTSVGRIYFIGQLGKYLPGSVWPILAQMELGTAYRVPRARSATTRGPRHDDGAAHRAYHRARHAPVHGALGPVPVGLPGRAGADRLPPPEAAQPDPAIRVQAGQAARPGRAAERPGAGARDRLVVRGLDIQRPADLAARGQARRPARAGGAAVRRRLRVRLVRGLPGDLRPGRRSASARCCSSRSCPR